MVRGTFYDGETATAHDVEVRFAEGLLTIAGPLSRVWPANQIVAIDEPDRTGRVTLSLAGSPGRLEIADQALIAELSKAGSHIGSTRTWSRRHWSIALLSVVAVLGLAFMSLTVLPRWLAPIVPPSLERQLARPVEALLQVDAHACKSAEGQKALDRLTERLRIAGGINRPVHLTVVDDPLVNAFTLPGGRVLVMRGLIDKAGDGAELAGVIAHELGHVAHYDPTAMLLRQIGFNVLATSIGLGDSNSVGVGLSRDLLTRSYGRDAETAADAFAIETMAKAGLRADGLGRFFLTLEAHEEEAGHGSTWFSTHPPTELRRQQVARPVEGLDPFTETEWAAIRTMCGARGKDREKAK